MSKFAELRQKAGLTQRKLADLVGVDPSTVRNWERNRSTVEAFVRFAKLCVALECGPHDLYGVEDPTQDEGD